MLGDLAARAGAALAAAGLRLVTAESCTGGLAAQAVTAVPGSSAWFDRGFVAYSNQAKEEMLGVRQETLRAHGAVSEPVARELARGQTGPGGVYGFGTPSDVASDRIALSVHRSSQRTTAGADKARIRPISPARYIRLSISADLTQPCNSWMRMARSGT